MKKILLLLSVFYSIQTASAQPCAASNTQGCQKFGSGHVKEMKLISRELTAYKAIDDTFFIYTNSTCNPASGPASNKIMNPGNPVTLIARSWFYVVLDISDSAHYMNRTHIWIDYDQDGDFESNELLGQFGWSKLGWPVLLPCWTKTGKSYMRIRTTNNADTISKSDGCGTRNVAGSILDLEINMIYLPPPVADFSIGAGRHYVKQKVPLQVTDPDYRYKYTWNNKDSHYNNPNPKYPFLLSWTDSGNLPLKLLVEHCGSKDSISKKIRIYGPAKRPTAFFTPNPLIGNVDSMHQFIVTPNEGEYKYKWEIHVVGGNIYKYTDHNLSYGFNYGTNRICLSMGNDIGFSNWYCRNYVVHPRGHYNVTVFGGEMEWDSGYLYDNGGPDNDYYGTSDDNFQVITPSTTHHLQIQIQKLQLKDTGDRLYIYQGIGDKGKALHPAGGFTSNNIPTLPYSVYSDTGAFYVRAICNMTGNDSGFRIHWSMPNTNISGRVYFDRDSNCVFSDSIDRSFENFQLKIANKNTRNFTLDGKYWVGTDSTPKPVEVKLRRGWKALCPSNGKDTWNVSKPVIDFAVVPDTLNKDLQLSVTDLKWGFNVVRGMDGNLTMKTSNIGNTVIDSAHCVFRSSRPLSKLKVASGNYSATDTSLEFNVGKLDLFEYSSQIIEYKVKSTDSGSILFDCNCFPTSGSVDFDSSNNSMQIKLRIVYSHDPNDKQVSVFKTPDHKISKLDYFIRFQNTGTWPATDIIVRDTLDPLLDPESLQLLQTSHPCVLEQDGHYLAFVFSGINLQDSFHNEPESHGWFYYTVKPKPGLLEKQRIHNTAFIYFDAELPVVTNTTSNFWEIPGLGVQYVISGELWLFPVPAQDKLYFTLPVKNTDHVIVRVFALNGQKMLETRTAMSGKSNYLNTSNLPAGLYSIQVISKRQVYSAKFTVLH